MIRFSFMRIKALAAFFVASSYAFTNVAGLYAAESQFWDDRKRAAQRLRQSSDDGALPARDSLTSDQRQLLAQLPAAGHVDFRVTEPSSLAGGVADAAGRPFARSDLSRIPSWISSLVLPHAAVRDIHISPKAGAPLVVHVQDAHGLEEAQRNVAALIDSLRQERGISLVGLEGASGAFALDPFRAYPDPAVTKAIAEHFLKDATLTGAEYAGITSAAPPLLWGVEDKTRYEDNIRAFKESLGNKPAVAAYLKSLTVAAEDLKERLYSPALKEFDRRAAAYQDRREGLGAYVGYLMEAFPGDKNRYPNLRLLTEALRWEEGLDFKRVEKDRLRLVEDLARRLPEAALERMVRQSLLYRAGRMSYGDYYRFLRGLCAEHSIALTDYGSLGDYVAYVLVAERINRNELLDELFRLERAVQDALAASTPEKRLVEASRDIRLLDKLTSHAMSPADWLAYQTGRSRVLAAPLELKVAALGLDGAAVEVPRRLEGFEALLAPFESFCSYALDRNNALVKNLLVKMREEGTSAAILVAGGFHSEGLTRVLRQEDASYVVLTPKITDVPKDSRYLDVFARDPQPLEKLFEGDVINLVAPLVVNPGSVGPRSARFSAVTAARQEWEAGLGEAQAEALAAKLPHIRRYDSDGEGTVLVEAEGLREPVRLHRAPEGVRAERTFRARAAASWARLSALLRKETSGPGRAPVSAPPWRRLALEELGAAAAFAAAFRGLSPLFSDAWAPAGAALLAAGAVLSLFHVRGVLFRLQAPDSFSLLRPGEKGFRRALLQLFGLGLLFRLPLFLSLGLDGGLAPVLAGFLAGPALHAVHRVFVGSVGAGEWVRKLTLATSLLPADLQGVEKAVSRIELSDRSIGWSDVDEAVKEISKLELHELLPYLMRLRLVLSSRSIYGGNVSDYLTSIDRSLEKILGKEEASDIHGPLRTFIATLPHQGIDVRTIVGDAEELHENLVGDNSLAADLRRKLHRYITKDAYQEVLTYRAFLFEDAPVRFFPQEPDLEAQKQVQDYLKNRAQIDAASEGLPEPRQHFGRRIFNLLNSMAGILDYRFGDADSRLKTGVDKWLQEPLLELEPSLSSPLKRIKALVGGKDPLQLLTALTSLRKELWRMSSSGRIPLERKVRAVYFDRFLEEAFSLVVSESIGDVSAENAPQALDALRLSIGNLLYSGWGGLHVKMFADILSAPDVTWSQVRNILEEISKDLAETSRHMDVVWEVPADIMARTSKDDADRERFSADFRRSIPSFQTSTFLLDRLQTFLSGVKEDAPVRPGFKVPQDIPDIVLIGGSDDKFMEENELLLQDQFGNKGSSLMVGNALGVLTPSGGIIRVQVGRYGLHKKLAARLNTKVVEFLSVLEKEWSERLSSLHKEASFYKFNPSDQEIESGAIPLLLSVRTGSILKMPGILDTVLNVGMSDRIASALETKFSARFAYDTYMRFLMSYGTAAYYVPRERLDQAVRAYKEGAQVSDTKRMSDEQLREIVELLKKEIRQDLKDRGLDPRQFDLDLGDPYRQVRRSVWASLDSWDKPDSVAYRRIHGISENFHTPVTIQAMVFGNLSKDSGSGVLTSRHLVSPSSPLEGEFSVLSQGEDVVSGTVRPDDIEQLRDKNPGIYYRLIAIAKRLERVMGKSVTLEFTYQSDLVWTLQLAGADSADESGFAWLFTENRPPDGKGQSVFGGAYRGLVVFDLEKAQEIDARAKEMGLDGAVWVKEYPVPSDAGKVKDSKVGAVLTVEGGRTSHGAHIMLKDRIPGIVGVNGLAFGDSGWTLGGTPLKEGDAVSLDAHSSRGLVFRGVLPAVSSPELGPPEAEGSVPPAPSGNVSIVPVQILPEAISSSRPNAGRMERFLPFLRVLRENSMVGVVFLSGVWLLSRIEFFPSGIGVGASLFLSALLFSLLHWRGVYYPSKDGNGPPAFHAFEGYADRASAFLRLFIIGAVFQVPLVAASYLEASQAAHFVSFWAGYLIHLLYDGIVLQKRFKRLAGWVRAFKLPLAFGSLRGGLRKAPEASSPRPGTPSIAANVFSGALSFLNWVPRLLLIGATFPHEYAHYREGVARGRPELKDVRWHHFLSGMPWETRGPPALRGLRTNALISAAVALPLLLLGVSGLTNLSELLDTAAGVAAFYLFLSNLIVVGFEFLPERLIRFLGLERSSDVLQSKRVGRGSSARAPPSFIAASGILRRGDEALAAVLRREVQPGEKDMAKMDKAVMKALDNEESLLSYIDDRMTDGGTALSLAYEQVKDYLLRSDLSKVSIARIALPFSKLNKIGGQELANRFRDILLDAFRGDAYVQGQLRGGYSDSAHLVITNVDSSWLSQKLPHLWEEAIIELRRSSPKAQRAQIDALKKDYFASHIDVNLEEVGPGNLKEPVPVEDRLAEYLSKYASLGLTEEEARILAVDDYRSDWRRHVMAKLKAVKERSFRLQANLNRRDVGVVEKVAIQEVLFQLRSEAASYAELLVEESVKKVTERVNAIELLHRDEVSAPLLMQAMGVRTLDEVRVMRDALVKNLKTQLKPSPDLPEGDKTEKDLREDVVYLKHLARVNAAYSAGRDKFVSPVEVETGNVPRLRHLMDDLTKDASPRSLPVVRAAWEAFKETPSPATFAAFRERWELYRKARSDSFARSVRDPRQPGMRREAKTGETVYSPLFAYKKEYFDEVVEAARSGELKLLREHFRSHGMTGLADTLSDTFLMGKYRSGDEVFIFAAVQAEDGGADWLPALAEFNNFNARNIAFPPDEKDSSAQGIFSGILREARDRGLMAPGASRQAYKDFLGAINDLIAKRAPEPFQVNVKPSKSLIKAGKVLERMWLFKRKGMPMDAEGALFAEDPKNPGRYFPASPVTWDPAFNETLVPLSPGELEPVEVSLSAAVLLDEEPLRHGESPSKRLDALAETQEVQKKFRQSGGISRRLVTVGEVQAAVEAVPLRDSYAPPPPTGAGSLFGAFDWMPLLDAVFAAAQAQGAVRASARRALDNVFGAEGVERILGSPAGPLSHRLVQAVFAPLSGIVSLQEDAAVELFAAAGLPVSEWRGEDLRLIRQALRDTGLGVAIGLSQVHPIRGPPPAGTDPERFVTFTRGPDGKTQIYVHEAVISSWRAREALPVPGSVGRTYEGYARNALAMTLFHERAESLGLPHGELAKLDLTPEGLDGIYGSSSSSEEVLSRVKTRGRNALDQASRRVVLTTALDAREERMVLDAFKARLEAERLEPGAGGLPLVVAVSDQHGAADKFDALLLDAFRAALPAGTPLPGRLDPAKSLSSQGVPLEALRGKVYFHNIGDFMDRGPFGIKVFRRSRELVEAGLSSFVNGNHDLWPLMNLLGLHLPSYEGYRFYGYQDHLGDVRSFVDGKRRLLSDARDPSWWAARLAEYTAHHQKRQKDHWSRYDDLVNGAPDPVTKKRAGGLYETVKGSLSPDQAKLWDKLRGRNKAGQEVATGVRAAGLMSLNWWRGRGEEEPGLLGDLRRAYDSSGLDEDSAEALAWRKAIAAVEEISAELDRELRERLAPNPDKGFPEGEWWWRAFQALGHGNYSTPEWWAMDWIFHKGWGSEALAEINVEAGVPGRITPSNYLGDPALKEVADFFRGRFSLYERDVYQNTYMHAFLPVDHATMEFHFSYRGVEYRGGTGPRSVWRGLDAVAADIRDPHKSLADLYDALELVNAWYADNTTSAKPLDVMKVIDTPEKRARFKQANGVSRLFTGHIPLQHLKTQDGFNVGDSFLFTDAGMAEKLGGRGAAVHVRDGVEMRGWEHPESGELKSSPDTVKLEKEGKATLFRNPGIPRDRFLSSVAADLDRRLQALDPPAGLLPGPSAFGQASLGSPFLQAVSSGRLTPEAAVSLLLSLGFPLRPVLDGRLSMPNFGRLLAETLSSTPMLSLSASALDRLLAAAEVSVAPFSSHEEALEEALSVPEVSRRIHRRNVHVLEGHIPGPPDAAGRSWEEGFVTFARDDAGALHLYVHRAVLDAWAAEGEGLPGYLQNALLTMLLHEAAEAAGVPHVRISKEFLLDVDGLATLYGRFGGDAARVREDVLRRGREVLGEASGAEVASDLRDVLAEPSSPRISRETVALLLRGTAPAGGISEKLEESLRIAERYAESSVLSPDLSVARRYGLEEGDVEDLYFGASRAASASAPARAGYSLGLAQGADREEDPEGRLRSFLGSLRALLSRSGGKAESVGGLVLGHGAALGVLKRGLRVDPSSPASFSDMAGKDVYPVFHIPAGLPAEERSLLISRLWAQAGAMPRESLRRVIVVSDDRLAASDLSVGLDVPIEAVRERDVLSRRAEDSQDFYYVDDLLARLPAGLRSALQSSLEGGNLLLPVTSHVVAEWKAQDPRLRAATLLLQILGKVLVRLSMDAADDVRRALLLSIQA